MLDEAKLLLYSIPLFSDLAYILYNNVDIYASENVPTMGVKFNNDSKRVELTYNPGYVKKLSKGHVALVLLHELLHIWLGHLALKVEKVEKYYDVDFTTINLAADYEVNIYIRNLLDTSGYYVRSIFDLEHSTLVFPDCLEHQSETLFFWLKFLKKNPRKLENIEYHSGIGSMGDPADYFIISEKIKIPEIKVAPNKEKNEIDDICKIISSKYGIIKGFRKPHKYNLAKVLTDSILPTCTRIHLKGNICLVIDVSSSMDYDSLKGVYPTIEKGLTMFKPLNYALVNTEVVESGIIPNKDFLKKISTSGGTNFEKPIKELAKKFTHFWVYTDGHIGKFSWPNHINREEQVWLIVNNSHFSIPGRIIHI